MFGHALLQVALFVAMIIFLLLLIVGSAIAHWLADVALRFNDLLRRKGVRNARLSNAVAVVGAKLPN